MSHQSEMANRVYQQLAQSQVSAADLVQELRAKWGSEHGAPDVHRFVEEVAACILQHEDVEVGDLCDGRFSAWTLEACDAHDRLARELLALDTFLEDRARYVFRRRD
jgi:hypothetical protein